MVSNILRTLVYADIFDYPLTASEIHHWLIKDQTLTEESGGMELIKKNLIQKTKSFYYLKGRKKIVSLRQKRFRFSQLKCKKVKKIVNFLKLIPFIKLIAITGALAMNNSDKNDDLDLMIITQKNRLWLTRLLVYLFFFPFIRQSDRKKNRLCLNLWLDISELKVPQNQQSLFTAHEVCQIKPLLNRDNTYQKFLTVNLWVKFFLPNAVKGQSLTRDPTERRVETAKLEGLSLIDKINTLAFHLQHAYMRKKITNEKVAFHSAFFHPRLTSEIVLDKYHQRLQSCRVPNLRRSAVLKTKITILVTGCFDILHQEHKIFLLNAKEQGDILIVGLETDQRVKQLKGRDRPCNLLNTRIKNLNKWGIADQVISLPKNFSKPSQHRALINQIKPNILAVSSHTPNLKAKRKLMKSIGGSVKVVHSHNPQISTTKLLKREI